MSDPAAHVVILGAGHAGGTAAALLRQYGFEGPITLIGEEPIAPYQRPPLSKAWLKGEADADSLALKPESFYAEAGIDLRLSTTVKALKRTAKVVVLQSGEESAYDTLISGTGAAAAAARRWRPGWAPASLPWSSAAATSAWNPPPPPGPWAPRPPWSS